MNRFLLLLFFLAFSFTQLAAQQNRLLVQKVTRGDTIIQHVFVPGDFIMVKTDQGKISGTLTALTDSTLTIDSTKMVRLAEAKGLGGEKAHFMPKLFAGGVTVVAAGAVVLIYALSHDGERDVQLARDGAFYLLGSGAVMVAISTVHFRPIYRSGKKVRFYTTVK